MQLLFTLDSESDPDAQAHPGTTACMFCCWVPAASQVVCPEAHRRVRRQHLHRTGWSGADVPTHGTTGAARVQVGLLQRLGARHGEAMEPWGPTGKRQPIIVLGVASTNEMHPCVTLANSAEANSTDLLRDILAAAWCCCWCSGTRMQRTFKSTQCHTACSSQTSFAKKLTN